MRLAVLRGVLALYTGLLAMPVPWLLVPDSGPAGMLLGFAAGVTAALFATGREDPVESLHSNEASATPVMRRGRR